MVLVASTSSCAAASSGSHNSSCNSLFLGTAVSRYDVDEIEEGGQPRKREKFVEMRRPDGSIAKSRGERTFYGAFTGGFNAGYWGTVGSKEGWEPSSFSSSRSKRETRKQFTIDDLMDEEDMRDHRASHRTLETKDKFASSARVRNGAGQLSAIPGGLPKEMQADFFGEDSVLGANMLKAGRQIEQKPMESIKNTDQEKATEKPGKPPGCALPPQFVARNMRGANKKDVASEAQVASGLAWRPKLVITSRATSSNANSRIEVRLERLWRHKVDTRGIGFGDDSVHYVPPSNRRLYLSGPKSLASKLSTSGYADFGTGVFDMDDCDGWEDIYDPTDKHANYEPLALKNDEIDDMALRGALADDDSPMTSSTCAGMRVASGIEGVVPGFIPEEIAESTNESMSAKLSKWLAPKAPKDYREVRPWRGSPTDEARDGSAEHQQLHEFLEKHGDRRLVDPACRAELLGMQSRGTVSADAACASSCNVVSASLDGLTARDPVSTEPSDKRNNATSAKSTQPLWKGMEDEKKQEFLKSLGRTFVAGGVDEPVGSNWDQPFKSIPDKQNRYEKFCLALEGKASAVEALQDKGTLTEVEREAELAEFGRVFKKYKENHPVDDVMNMLAKTRAADAPVLRRTVTTWVPQRLLCKRWGVPEPSGPPPGGLQGVKRQREYLDQVQAGLSKLMPPAAAQSLTGFSDGFQSISGSAGTGTSVPTETVEPPRPPVSLFTSIFGDGEDDD